MLVIVLFIVLFRLICGRMIFGFFVFRLRVVCRWCGWGCSFFRLLVLEWVLMKVNMLILLLVISVDMVFWLCL